MMHEIYPLRFEPVYRDYVWGGDRIVRKYRRGLPPGIYAESWEIADRPDGMSVVANGRLKGKTLHQLTQTMGEVLLGAGRSDESFPLLVKIIDARECLSVQVHPDDEGAARFGGEAKTEMWYALEAGPGAKVYAGLKKGVSPETLRSAIENHAVADCLKTVPMGKGTAVYVPGGRIHAIDAGCLLLEIQQNSNTTYRIYDWGRPRELHLEQALNVLRPNDDEDPRVDAGEFQCKYFIFRTHHLNDSQSFQNDGRSFHILFAEEGPLQIRWTGGTEDIEEGTTLLIPAALREWTVVPQRNAGSLVQISLPSA